jgi:hypothetical protein
MVNKVVYNKKIYGILELLYKNIRCPILLDWDDYIYIQNINKNWILSNNGFIFYKYKDINIYLHEIIISLMIKDKQIEQSDKAIIHINKINLDNSRDNLIYDSLHKLINKNLSKKKRYIFIPEKSINKDKIPTYMFYSKETQYMGDRFIIRMGNLVWNSTSCREYSINYKFEEAKKFMRCLKEQRSDIWNKFSMNGDFTKEGKQLYNLYYTIIKFCEYNHIKEFLEDKTDDYLIENLTNLSKLEKELLKNKFFDEDVLNF